MLSDGTWTYAYDHANRLVRAERASNGTDVDYRVESDFDAWGNRLSKSVDADADGALNPVVSRFSLDGWNPAKLGEFAVWAELEIDGTLATRHLPGDGAGEQLGRIDGASTDPTPRWGLVDRQGSTLAIVGAAGSVVGELRYDAFGRVTSETAPSASGLFGWTGGIRDVELALHLVGSQHYDASTGSWVARSPNGGFAVTLVSNNSPTARGPGARGPNSGPNSTTNIPPVPRPYEPDRPLWFEGALRPHTGAKNEESELASAFQQSYTEFFEGNRPTLGTGQGLDRLDQLQNITKAIEALEAYLQYLAVPLNGANVNAHLNPVPHLGGPEPLPPLFGRRLRPNDRRRIEERIRQDIATLNSLAGRLREDLRNDAQRPESNQTQHTDASQYHSQSWAGLWKPISVVLETGIMIGMGSFLGPIICSMAASESIILRGGAWLFRGWTAGSAIRNTATDIANGNYADLLYCLGSA